MNGDNLGVFFKKAGEKKEPKICVALRTTLDGQAPTKDRPVISNLTSVVVGPCMHTCVES